MSQDGKNTKSNEYLVPVCMFLGVIFATLCLIVAGYITSGMDVTKVYHSIVSS